MKKRQLIIGGLTGIVLTGTAGLAAVSPAFAEQVIVTVRDGIVSVSGDEDMQVTRSPDGSSVRVQSRYGGSTHISVSTEDAGNSRIDDSRPSGLLGSDILPTVDDAIQDGLQDGSDDLRRLDLPLPGGFDSAYVPQGIVAGEEQVIVGEPSAPVYYIDEDGVRTVDVLSAQQALERSGGESIYIGETSAGRSDGTSVGNNSLLTDLGLDMTCGDGLDVLPDELPGNGARSACILKSPFTGGFGEEWLNAW
ncbi:MAG: hypothetical protein PHW10_01230 [Candidatus Peribacteraceae bacterium]|nr:hypothetical protein [Candidatus Peribacteraceae bacterium]